MTRISVVTPTYNLIEAGRRDMIGQAIGSVRGQSHPDVELIVVDGGSTDGTQDLLQGLADAGEVDRLVSEPDNGLYDAMNKGARMATGDHLLFLNSDDFYHDPEGLAVLAAQLAQSGADFACSPVRMLDEDREWVAGVSWHLWRTLITMPCVHQGMAVRRTLFQDLGGFDLSFPIAADYDLVLRLYLSGAPYVVLDQPFTSFRTGGASFDIDRREEDAKAVLGARFARHGPFTEAELDRWRLGRRPLPRVMARLVADRSAPLRVRLAAAGHGLRSLLSSGRMRKDRSGG